MLTDPRFTAEVELTVPFHDSDPMGVVWHGNYFRYFEIAREALLNQFNYGYRQMRESGYVWPIVDTRVKYRESLQFEQKICVRATIEEFENRLKIAYQIFDAVSGRKTTTGYTIQVAVEENTQKMGFVSPDTLFERMGVRP
ncbi:acyl-CoA thioesterase [Xenorhabdus bovienii]|uniref:Acyl-CoA thioesterase n=1 Tax=Xenorhabdus bovienii TaxID=40576 RepID=A0AAJ1J3C5_XENBV|nr:thioesterase family protein [Xenorhabdus bovienii]MDE1476792.1 acyl-CoA thioesterase [Xenorhabdus bovienii]MDE1490679.1 acyl-CoA thioesterase [Xenorhabdus bovienii]MDE9508544.1 acyl-CoA thioesterase [Xenorhabdus bovienii]MDE9520179.1 acyl-CoA thioesterase [Xenorhabdus bovienii]